MHDSQSCLITAWCRGSPPTTCSPTPQFQIDSPWRLSASLDGNRHKADTRFGFYSSILVYRGARYPVGNAKLEHRTGSAGHIVTMPGDFLSWHHFPYKKEILHASRNHQWTFSSGNYNDRIRQNMRMVLWKIKMPHTRTTNGTLFSHVLCSKRHLPNRGR